MKNYKLPLLGFTLALLIVSCKKEDVQQENGINPSSSKMTAASQWNSLNNWSSAKTDSTITYFSKVSDSSITTDIVSEGMVLVYKKNGNNIQSLPFLENAKAYWYYQVSNGSLRINSDNNNGQNLSAQSFSYFIVTPQQLSDLEAKGKTKIDLLQLSYEQAAALLK